MLINTDNNLESLTIVLQQLLPQPNSTRLTNRFPKSVATYFAQLTEQSACSGVCSGSGGCMSVNN